MGMDDSNAALSKNAKELTGAAYKATDAANGSNGSHQDAARAHRDAQYANQRAGNGTTANKHAAIAAVHEEKATPDRAAKNFADTLGSHADMLSKKADMATAAGSAPADMHGGQFGDTTKQVQDPRSAHDLHKEAEKAHAKAGKAYGLTDCSDKQKYHEGKSVEHGLKAGAG